MVDGGGILATQGVTLHVVFDVTDADLQPVSLNGYHAKMQVRTRPGAPDPPLLDASTDNGMLTVEPGGQQGVVHLDVPASVTAEITSSGKYDCLAWLPSSPEEVLLIATGVFILRKSVTVR